jgi:hypothetical protein
MSDIDEKTYIALQMACELRQVIADRLGGAPDLGMPPGCYPLEPLEGESFESACRRVFGDYVYNKIMYERAHPEEKFPKRLYEGWKPKGPHGVRKKSLPTAASDCDFYSRRDKYCGPNLREEDGKEEDA